MSKENIVLRMLKKLELNICLTKLWRIIQKIPLGRAFERWSFSLSHNSNFSSTIKLGGISILDWNAQFKHKSHLSNEPLFKAFESKSLQKHNERKKFLSKLYATLKLFRWKMALTAFQVYFCCKQNFHFYFWNCSKIDPVSLNAKVQI